MAQPCSYIYPIYSVVKRHRPTACAAPWGADDALSKAQAYRLNLIQCVLSRVGGAERDRTVDPLLAKQVLSQLSYSPMSNLTRVLRLRNTVKMVGLGRFELPTSPLSGVRSSQLSYRPRSLLPTSSHSPAAPLLLLIVDRNAVGSRKISRTQLNVHTSYAGKDHRAEVKT